MKKRVPSEKEIARKHGVSLDYVVRQAEIGSTVEREHVTTHEEAYGIALQHIAEFPDYYKHLLSMEKQLKKEWEKKKPIKENHIAVAMGKEIDDEGGMIMSQLDTIEEAVNRLRECVKDPKMQLPGWVQSKITLACDYIDTAADYMSSKNESVSFSISGRKSTGLRNMTKSDAERHSPDAAAKHKQEREKVDLPNVKKKTFEEFMQEGMDMKSFKSHRAKIKRAAETADARKRGHEGSEWHNSGRTYSPDEAKSRRANMSDAERSARHASAVDPDNEDHSNYSADKTKNPKKQRKQSAMGESAAWTNKEGKNKNGGLNEKGRKSYERENPGSDLKAPSKKVGNPRRASFCARMRGMKDKLTSKKTASDPDSRINKSLRAWNC